VHIDLGPALDANGGDAVVELGSAGKGLAGEVVQGIPGIEHEAVAAILRVLI